MQTFLAFLVGKKTYFAAAGFALLALYAVINGDGTQAGQYLLTALGFLGVRAAIARQDQVVIQENPAVPPDVLKFRPPVPLVALLCLGAIAASAQAQPGRFYAPLAETPTKY